MGALKHIVGCHAGDPNTDSGLFLVRFILFASGIFMELLDMFQA